MRLQRTKLFTAFATVVCLGLTGCAGSVGSHTNASEGESVPAGASDAEYQEALQDMPETTLVYQPSGASPNVPAAPRDVEFKNRVEEASGGKIKIELVWGQAIAGYSELDDALADGRVDIALTQPLYNPAEYPVNDAFLNASTLAGASPRTGDLVTNAALLETAWDSEEMSEEIESKGLHPLLPFVADGPQMIMCSEPIVSAEDWEGRQVRVASAVQNKQVKALGATPVSLEFQELYEALQRGTVDCTTAHGLMASGVGFLDLVPYAMYSEEVSFGAGAHSIIGGSGYAELPLAARQLIFDQLVTMIEQQRLTSMQGSADVAESARANGGEVCELDNDSVRNLQQLSEGLVQQSVSTGAVSEDFQSDVNRSLEKWHGNVEQLGLLDEGDFETFDQWHNPDELNIEAYADRIYDEVLAKHRPQ